VRTARSLLLFAAGFVLGAGADRLLSEATPHAAPGPAAQESRAPAAASPREPAGAAQAPARETAQVERVIDGDTLTVAGGRAVRLLGVDTPERDEPFYGEARAFLEGRARGRTVRLAFCAEEPRDRYGRLLAFVEAGGEDAGAGLLDRGLARTLLAGPCARPRAADYLRREREAFRAGRGIWSLQEPRRTGHAEAGKYVGWLMTVTGTVQDVFVGPRAVHLNFGPDHRSDFTAVIFRRDLARLSGQGLLLPVTAYRGRRVEVTGVVETYNGPEIVVRAADQLAPLP